MPKPCSGGHFPPDILSETCTVQSLWQAVPKRWRSLMTYLCGTDVIYAIFSNNRIFFSHWNHFVFFSLFTGGCTSRLRPHWYSLKRVALTFQTTTYNPNSENYHKEREMKKPFWGLLCVVTCFLCSWRQRRRTEVYLLTWHKRCSDHREPRSSASGDEVLAAAGGGAHRAAHAQFGRGLWLRFGFWLRDVIVCGTSFGFTFSTGVITSRFWRALLLTPF